MLVKVSGDAVNVTSVPVLPSEGPTTCSGPSDTPCANATVCSLPARQMRSSKRVDSALTTETPTPCRPPETL
jgi:hypothetical protein